MRPAALVVLLALPLATAPVPKGIKANTFERQLFGTWVHTDPAFTETIEFKPDGTFTYTHAFTNRPPSTDGKGHFRVIEADAPATPRRVVRKFTTGNEQEYE